jgi:hypothetical protein
MLGDTPVEPLPFTPSPTRARLQREVTDRREKSESLIRAFLSEADGVAIDAPITEGYLSRYRSSAFSLLSVGATPESIRNAVKAQRLAWPGQRNLDLIFIEKEWPRLSVVKVPPSNPAVSTRMTPEEMDAMNTHRRQIEEFRAKCIAERAQAQTQSQPELQVGYSAGEILN